MAYTVSTDYKKDEIQLARFAKAMGHPARIAILKYLSSTNACYFNEINKELPITKATVSQHLAELKDAGLIRGSIEPPKVNYCIDSENWTIARKLFISLLESSCLESGGECCSGNNR